MHCGWRLYVRFLRVCSKQLDVEVAVIDDPTVKAFNKSLYFLWRCTRAAAEYLLHLSRTSGAVDLDLAVVFIESCEANIDLAWLVHIVHFLNDLAFLTLDFKQAIRAGDCKRLDLLWRKFFASGRTSIANKSHYVPMAILRFFLE
eukprot:3452164-Pleurochrysis_carterae.AAC.1